MLGRSHAVSWGLCSCRHCRKPYRSAWSYKQHWKRSARRRERELWRRDEQL